MEIKNYNTADEALRGLTDRLIELMEQKKEGIFSLALSGGETAKQMFSLWVNEYKSAINRNRICFYWVDERCVPKTDDESNFGHAYRLLLRPLGIPNDHYHRIKGENYPPIEVERYSKKLREELPERNGLPHFDCIILGVGNDAHTASIFPDNMGLLTDNSLYAVSQHPQTGQRRITMTGPLILNDTPLLVPVLGKGKELVIKQLEAGYTKTSPTPATYILSKAKDATVFITREA